MNTLGHLFGMTKATEVLIVTLVGICCTIFDASILDLNTNLGKVWSVPLDPQKFSQNSEMFIKYLLSGIVLVRTFSVHLYLAFYIVMLWPAVFEERPNLLLPWLTVGAVKSLGMGFFAFSVGMYACFVYGAWRPACIDFFFAQIIDNAPSMYAWIIVLSYYRDLKSLTLGGFEKNLDKTNNIPDELVIRRRMTRSINADPLVDNKNENFANRVRSDTNTIESRSLDSLLVKISNEGYVEGNASSEVFAPSDEDPKVVNYVQRTIKVLDITDSDIQRAKMQQRNRCPMPSSGDLLQLLESNAQQATNETTLLAQNDTLRRNVLDGVEVSNRIETIKKKVKGFAHRTPEMEGITQMKSNDNEIEDPTINVKKGVRQINGILERRRPKQKQAEEGNRDIGTTENIDPDIEEDKKSRLTFSETSSHSISGSSVYSQTMSNFFHQFVQDVGRPESSNIFTHNKIENKDNSDKEVLMNESEICSTNYEKDGSLLSLDSESTEFELCNSSLMHSACCSRVIQPVDGLKYLGFEGKCYTILSGYPKSEEINTENKEYEKYKHRIPILHPNETVKLKKPNKLLPKYVNDGYTQDYLRKICKTKALNEDV